MLCKCGCGRTTKVNTRNEASKGWEKGKSRNYIRGHNVRGKRSNHWKGGKHLDKDGYFIVLNPGYRKNNYVYEHTIVAESVFGKRLPLKAVVHHVDEDRSNNQNNNLVICENLKYHFLLHKRMRAISACGNPRWVKCQYCGMYGPPETMKKKSKAYHKKCNAEYEMKRIKKKMATLHDTRT